MLEGKIQILKINTHTAIVINNYKYGYLVKGIIRTKIDMMHSNYHQGKDGRRNYL